MMLSQLKCPQCNIYFKDSLFVKQRKKSIQLDKIYYYNFIQTFCSNCKQQVCIFLCQTPILWLKQQQYSYSKFVKNVRPSALKNKRFLYLYYPNTNQDIINFFSKKINFDKIDALITTQSFANKINFNKQICIFPQYLFQPIKNSYLPNYFVQRIIIRHLQKFEDPYVYSTYYTFSNIFTLLAKQKEWKIIN